MATPPPEPPHSGVRPLSPWGEGYCRYCHFVVGLTYDGLLVLHDRGAQLHSNAACKGGGTRPPKVTPYASRKAAFTAKSEKVNCHVCGRGVYLLADGRMSDHNPSAPAPVLARCSGGYRLPEGDHANERGR